MKARLTGTYTALTPRARHLPDVNFADWKYGPRLASPYLAGTPQAIFSSSAPNCSQSCAHASHSWKEKDASISITLTEPTKLNQVVMLLWDGDKRWYKYRMEASVDGQSYVPIADRSQLHFASWQIVDFDDRIVKIFKIIGVHNTANTAFHMANFRAYYRIRN